MDKILRPAVRPSVLPSARPSVRPTVHPSDRPSVRPSVHPSVCPSVSRLTLHFPSSPTDRATAAAPLPSSALLRNAPFFDDRGWVSLVDEGRIGRELFLSLRARARAIITRREFRHRQRLLTSSRRRWPRTRTLRTWREIEKPGAHSRSFTWRRRRQKEGGEGGDPGIGRLAF